MLSSGTFHLAASLTSLLSVGLRWDPFFSWWQLVELLALSSLPSLVSSLPPLTSLIASLIASLVLLWFLLWFEFLLCLKNS